MWADIPGWLKSVSAVIVATGVLFFISRQTLPRDPFRYGPLAAEKLRNVLAVARQSYERARRAKTPYEQLLHIQWGMAFAKAGRMLGKNVETVSTLCGIDIDEFIGHLEAAERMCVARLEQSEAQAQDQETKDQ